MSKIKVECRACDTTGVYVDTHFPKPDGVGLLCRECKGHGYREVSIAAGSVSVFTQRRVRHGIRKVWPSMSVWTADHDYSRYAVSYDDFRSGYMPRSPQ